MGEELKPCPFCGGEAKWVDIENGENFGGSCVCCTDCQASTNVSFQFHENLISAWNTRALPATPVSVKVKPLEWIPTRLAWTSASSIGEYKTYDGGEDSRCDRFSVHFAGKHFSSYPTLDEAKAAAQADYEGRILSALDLTPITLADALELPEIKAVLTHAGRVLTFDEWSRNEGGVAPKQLIGAHADLAAALKDVGGK